MKNILLSTFAAAAVAVGSAHAQIASDNAGNYSSGWTNGANGGIGFQPWSLGVSAGATNFIGNPADAGLGTVGIGTSAFGMRSTQPGNYATASRAFSNAMNVGETLTFFWGINWDTDNNNGSVNKGFNLLAGASQIFNVNIGGTSSITVNGINADTNYGANPMSVSLFRSATGYDFTLTSRSGGPAYNVSVATNVAVNSIAFYANNNNADVNRNMYFNNLSVVPEPSTYALLALSAVGLAGYAARRRARK